MSLLFSCISVLEVSVEISSSSEILSSVMSMSKPTKGSLHFCYSVLIWSVSFLFLISLFLLKWPICSWMLSVLPIGALSILIIVVLNSWSDNFSIPAISVSCSHACYVSSKCVFCLSVCLKIFLGSRTLIVWGKSSCCRQTLAMWRSSAGGVEMFYSHMIRPQSFSECMHWNMNFTSASQLLQMPPPLLR